MATWTAKKVGAKNALWLDDADRTVIAGRHFAKQAQMLRKGHVCNFCGQEWPCDAAQLLHDLEATRDAHRRMVTWPF